MSAPQVVTERYVTNLIHYGRNKEYSIQQVRQHPSMVSGDAVGVYFEVIVRGDPFTDDQIGRGATIQQAVRRALEKHGVTFR